MYINLSYKFNVGEYSGLCDDILNCCRLKVRRREENSSASVTSSCYIQGKKLPLLLLLLLLLVTKLIE
jgi:hypothetical protein